MQGAVGLNNSNSGSWLGFSSGFLQERRFFFVSSVATFLVKINWTVRLMVDDHGAHSHTPTPLESVCLEGPSNAAVATLVFFEEVFVGWGRWCAPKHKY